MALTPERSHDNQSRDAELVARACAGDRSAEEALYRTHVQAVTGLAMRLLGRSSEAEDVVQDAFITALSRISQLRERALFRPWLLRITVHEVHRRFRRRKLLRTLGFQSGDAHDDDVSLARLAAPSCSPEARAELRALDRVLAELPTRERIAWMLRHVEGHELAEIAAACDTSLASVKRWIARADARVQAYVHAEVSHE